MGRTQWESTRSVQKGLLDWGSHLGCSCDPVALEGIGRWEMPERRAGRAALHALEQAAISGLAWVSSWGLLRWYSERVQDVRCDISGRILTFAGRIYVPKIFLPAIWGGNAGATDDEVVSLEQPRLGKRDPTL